MGAVLCVYETTRARLPREFIDSRATASFGRRSVLSSLLPLFWLTVAPCRAYGGRFVESNDVPSSGKEESFLVRGEIYIYICIYIFILFVKFIGEGKIVSSLKFDPPLEIVVDYFRGA